MSVAELKDLRDKDRLYEYVKELYKLASFDDLDIVRGIAGYDYVFNGSAIDDLFNFKLVG
jgi:hypothetical protein